MKSSPRRHTRKFAFSLRSLYATAGLVTVLIALFAYRWHRYERHKETIASLQETGLIEQIVYHERCPAPFWKYLISNRRLTHDVREIRVWGNAVEDGDLSPVAMFRKVKSVSVYGSATSSLTSLQDLNEVESLSITETSVRDVSVLSRMPQMRELFIRGGAISDISSLGGLTEIKQLYLLESDVSNVSALSNLTQCEELAVSGAPISDITPLSNLVRLKKLWLDRTKVTSISALSRLIHLEELVIEETPISDLSPLKALTNLKTLHLFGTKVVDLTPLANHVNVQIYIYDEAIVIPTRLRGRVH